MALTVILLSAILLAILGGGIFLYQVLVTIMKLLEQLNGKLPTSPILKSLLSI
jgi:hypothetical protein